MTWFRGADVVMTAGGAELKTTRDATLNMEGSEVDLSVRGMDGWGATGVALKNASVDANLIWDDADGGFAGVLTAYMARAALEVIITGGGHVFTAQMVVTKFSQGQPVDGALTADVTFKVAYDLTSPPTFV